ncbi:uncharacterized protein J8A68_001320 [[Candida] subhashii]|uniref:Uncharacterized protein n=1 Tax=[Candida] subhashii TaxID=561895 RepID=A0A8J5QGD5_9ASCO|nr:uncharacterized protein J8A68_001320 [[Candida] subhashii]KAG7665264.1 hypothetical protein J8A68_001320 [[Candida] subhashii]
MYIINVIIATLYLLSFTAALPTEALDKRVYEYNQNQVPPEHPAVSGYDPLASLGPLSVPESSSQVVITTSAASKGKNAASSTGKVSSFTLLLTFATSSAFILLTCL